MMPVRKLRQGSARLIGPALLVANGRARPLLPTREQQS
jgi:hypothetical protein